MKNIDFLNKSMFLDDDHQERFYECLRKFNVIKEDYYRLSFFYIFTSNEEIYSKIQKIYNFQENCLITENFEIVLSKLPQSYGCLIRLAIKLFNDLHFRDYDFFDNFDYLDDDNRFVLMQSMMIRF